MDLLGLLGFLGDAIDSQIGAVIDWTFAGFNTLFGDISGVASTLGNFIKWAVGAIGAIVAFISALWKWLRDSIISKIITFIRQIIARIRQFLAPFIQWIQLERQLLYRLWYTYIRPLMNFIQDLRRFLLVFRLLGFKWAKQLDQYLVALENKINAAFLGALQNLNILANWINFILDPFGLFQPVPLLGAIARSLGALIGIVNVGMLNPNFTGTSVSVTTPPNYYDNQVAGARIQAYALGGPLPDDQVMFLAVSQGFAELGYTTPVA